MSFTTMTTLTFDTVECYRCGVIWGMPRYLNERCLADHSRDFYCPNGHGQRYVGKTEAEKQRERAERLANQLTHTKDQLRATERSNVALKGVVTRTKKRVGNGVCPCCNRTFQNLARHMAGQHPEYADSDSP